MNKENWNKRTEVHFDSPFYDVQGFLAGESSLRIPEMPLLRDIKGLELLHLQCHFGLDTLSMARMGAKVTGADLSDQAIEKAQELTVRAELDAQFVCSDIYDLPNNLHGQFDIVFTTYGTVGWLPDIKKWASVVKHFLKPGSRLIMVDFHPALWMLDETEMKTVKYRYFNSEAIIEEEEGSYAGDKPETPIRSISWNHGMAEIIGALIGEGMTIADFQEYDYSSYDCFANMVEVEPMVYRHKDRGNMIPMMYSIVAVA